MATRSESTSIYDELRGTPERPRTGFTWEDLLGLPDGPERYEIIGGELIVTPTPAFRHQRVSQRLGVILSGYEGEHGGVGLGLPFTVHLSDRDVIQPDCIYLRPESVDRLEENRVVGPPDLIVEISSPSTRRLDLRRKRELYERYGVPEYWFVDLDAHSVLVYRLAEDRYSFTRIMTRADTLTSSLLPGLSIPVEGLFS